MRRRDLIAASLAIGGARAALAAAPRQVVLELFTSQGCSSCPPADALLGQLTRRPGVIALAWHVDYWDHLGWHDRFASRAATARQKAYARQLGTDVFTPALIVDGTKVVVGSQRTAVEVAVEAASALPVTITVSRSDDVSVDVRTAPGGALAQRLIYDPEQTTDVGAGENGGVRLREFRIVREIETLAEWDGAARQFRVKPPGPGQGQVILVQSPNLQILGAADLPPG